MSIRVLVIRFSAMGDLLLTTGPLAHLRKKFPAMEIDLLTSPVGEELFINSTDISNTIVVNKGASLFELIRVYKKMRHYDVVIDLQGNFKSYFLKAFQRGEFFRIEKHSKQRRAFVRNRKHKDELGTHVVDKYYKTIRKAFSELPDRSTEELRPIFPPQNFTFDRKSFDFSKSIALHPFASQKNKQWPYFEELIQSLILKDIPVTLIGHSDDEITVPESPLVMNLVNKTTLREMASILRNTKALVTTDSGPMHMGVAVNTPTIALFGPTTKEFGFDPRFKNAWVLEENLECRPCHVHGGNVCPLGHHKCMNNIAVKRVEKTLNAIL